MCATVSWGAHESFMHPIFVLKNGCDKLFMKKEEELEKMDKYLKYLKQWVLRCTPEIKKMNNIAHIFLQSCFQVLKERYVFKE
jgi:hypothetical protein